MELLIAVFLIGFALILWNPPIGMLFLIVVGLWAST